MQIVPEIREHVSLARYTTLRIGGEARYFCEARTEDELNAAIAWARERGIPLAILGGGSNTLVSERGFLGLVLIPRLQVFSIEEDGCVMAEAGVVTALLARKVSEAGWQGFSWAVGLPGTIGGAIFGNAGCFGGETADFLERVDVIDQITGEKRSFSKDELNFSYRSSAFSRLSLVITRGYWRFLKKEDPEVLKRELDTILNSRKTHQPLGAASAGCMFKNPALTDEEIVALECLWGTVPRSAHGRVPAGWLIEKAGLKGCVLGTVSVSDQHANFMHPTRETIPDDIVHLIEHVQTVVYNACHIHLEPEVRFLGVSLDEPAKARNLSAGGTVEAPPCSDVSDGSSLFYHHPDPSF